MRILFLAPVLCLTAAACSSTETPADAGPGAQVCPTTIVEATAAPKDEGTSSKCHVENFACVVGYSCDNFVQQATCVCSNGVFACTKNVNGETLDSPVTDPQCETSAGSAAVCSLCESTAPDGGLGDPCPADKTTASGTVCHNAGQICDYTTTCGGSPPPTDTCQCLGNKKGDAGLSWSCDLNNCP